MAIYDDWSRLAIHVALDNTVIEDDISKYWAVWQQFLFKQNRFPIYFWPVNVNIKAYMGCGIWDKIYTGH